MDIHQSYCSNFLALTDRRGRGTVSVAAAWALSVLGFSLTIAAAWLIAEILSNRAVPIDLNDMSQLQLWVSVFATVLNYLRFFRYFLGAVAAGGRPAALLSHRSGRAAFALAALLGPAAVMVIGIALAN